MERPLHPPARDDDEAGGPEPAHPRTGEGQQCSTGTKTDESTTDNEMREVVGPAKCKHTKKQDLERDSRKRHREHSGENTTGPTAGVVHCSWSLFSRFFFFAGPWSLVSSFGVRRGTN